MDLADHYVAVRRASEELVAPLSAEDCAIQSMEDASPAKWHLAHTTWFFETILLEPLPGFAPFDPDFRVLFNSYYQTLGPQHPRPRRGLLSRPSLERVLEYRRDVDARVMALLSQGERSEETDSIVELGLHHEQQHQELLLTDIKHALAQNPTRPAYREGDEPDASGPARPRQPDAVWHEFAGGLREIGFAGAGFSFDNERPAHRVHLEPWALADRPVTCAEFLAFMADGGYATPELWVADGWAAVQREGWRAPLYWEERDGGWQSLRLCGHGPVAPDEPVCHVSWYEADAFARWAGARLPTEAEWECAADGPVEGRFLESGRLHPAPVDASAAGPAALFGDVWEWTASPYVPYPGFRPLAGSLGEYNGKFMSSQMVLRGGSCATPRSHIRRSYRNFFYPWMRWQFSGIRLARDA